eukprot:1158700-Pelagomonas_calceolata.AAC.14
MHVVAVKELANRKVMFSWHVVANQKRRSVITGPQLPGLSWALLRALLLRTRGEAVFLWCGFLDSRPCNHIFLLHHVPTSLCASHAGLAPTLTFNANLFPAPIQVEPGHSQISIPAGAECMGGCTVMVLLASPQASDSCPECCRNLKNVPEISRLFDCRSPILHSMQTSGRSASSRKFACLALKAAFSYLPHICI